MVTEQQAEIFRETERQYNVEVKEEGDLKQPKTQWPMELLTALEAMCLSNINDYNVEIGTFLKCKETTKNQETEARLDLIIFMTRYKIEENYEDIQRYREWKKEFS